MACLTNKKYTRKVVITRIYFPVTYKLQFYIRTSEFQFLYPAVN